MNDNLAVSSFPFRLALHFLMKLSAITFHIIAYYVDGLDPK